MRDAYLVWGPGHAVSIFTLVKTALFYLSALCVVTGPLFALLPRQTIRLQIALFAAIQWRLEPVSMEKEIRNTRLMGAVIALCGIATYLLTCRNFR